MNYPNRCPITGLPFFGVVSHPEKGQVPVYGEREHLYTIPELNDEGDLFCYLYCPDVGWDPVPEFVSSLEDLVIELLKKSRESESEDDWWSESVDYVLKLVG
jgi:hypothetical protein